MAEKPTKEANIWKAKQIIGQYNLKAENQGNTTTFQASIGSSIIEVTLTCGAKFWIVSFYETLSIINQLRALGIGFADDCCILLHREHINDTMSLIQRIGDQLLTRGSTMGLSFNPTNTICIQFTPATDKKGKYHEIL